jgi:outer membrane protein assembly factor BamE
MTAETMRPSTLLQRLALVGLLALGTGCLYRMPIQQGNVLDPIQVDQLEKGMTRSQVMFLLGTPMVPNGFNTDRWDYYYFVDAGVRHITATKRMTVYFKDDKVERVERGEGMAAATAAPVGVPEPAATPATNAAPAAGTG